MRREGQSIVSLVVGEPDFDTPPTYPSGRRPRDGAGRDALHDVAGTLELRQAIAAKLERENGLIYAPQRHHRTNGAKSAIYSALAATLEPGDEVIVPAPYWVSYPDMVLACDGTPVTVACPESRASS